MLLPGSSTPNRSLHLSGRFVLAACLIMSCGAWLSICAQSDGEARWLEPNKAIERPLSAKEKHLYWINLVAGDYVNLSPEGEGCLLTATLFKPDGDKVSGWSIGALSDRQEFILEKTGRHRVEVEGGDFEGTGSYSLLITVRPHTRQEANRIAGRRIFHEGERLRFQGKAEDLRQAIGKFEEALRLWRAAEFRLGQADALSSLGRIYRLLGEQRRAIEFYEQALPLWLVENNRFGEGYMLMNLGVAHSELGEKRIALEYYRLALVVNRVSRANLAGTLGNLGGVYHSLGDYQASIDYRNQALVIHRELGRRDGEAITLSNMGTMFHELGERAQSYENYQQAMAIWREIKDLRGQAMTLTSIGHFHIVAREGKRALEVLTQALALQRTTSNPRGEAYTLRAIGRAYQTLGDSQKALDAFNQALALLRAGGDRDGEAAVLNAIGNVYQLLLKDQSQAFDHYTAALALSQKVEDRIKVSDVLFRLAQIYREQGKLDQASDNIEQAIGLAELHRTKIPNDEWRASFLATEQVKYALLIDLLLQQHRQNPLEGHAAKAFEVAERARARTLLEALSRARSEIRKDVDPALIERETDLSEQLSFKEQNYAQLLSRKNSAEQAAIAKKELERLLAEQREVSALIRARNPRYAALIHPKPLSLSEVQKQVLDDDTALLEYSLGEERSYLFAVTKTSFDVYELPKRAEIEDLAGEFYRLSARTFMKWTAESENRHQAVAAKLSRMILSPAAASLKKKRLLIVAEGALQYIPFAALTVVGGRLPVAGNTSEANRFPNPDSRLLIEGHEIISLPSASTLAVLRQELNGRQAAPKTLAVLGDPVFSKDDPRLVADAKPAQAKAARGLSVDAGTLRRSLRLGAANASAPLQLTRLNHTRSEALAIASLVPADSKLLALGFEANRQLATGADLSQYRIVHFATHGWLDAATPDLSAVVLSLVDKKSKPQNGFLRLHEIYNLNLPAELVVLSACETGIGKEVKGEGLISLTRGFMYAGARRVLVSLWPVDDPATAELMKRFYRGMLKENLAPSVALKKAQIEMRKQPRWRSPYFWAGFVLQGEW